jgi:hypothetical protein
MLPFAPRRRALALAGAVASITACGAAPAVPGAEPPPPVARESQLSAMDGREICLVGRYGTLNLDVHFGDPAHSPGYVVVWVGRQAVRLGVDPRPAEERDRLLDETVAVRGHFQLRPPPASTLPAAPPGSATTGGVTALDSLPLLLPVFEPEPFRTATLGVPAEAAPAPAND